MKPDDIIAWYCFEDKKHTAHKVTSTTSDETVYTAQCTTCGTHRGWDSDSLTVVIEPKLGTGGYL